MNWHYVEQGQQVGPVTDEQLQQLLQAGRITADTLVWHEGLPDWISYQQATAQTAPPPIEPSNPAAVGSAPSDSEVVCAECGKMFPVSETVKFGKASVCAACKPIFLQKLSEGAQINTGELAYARIPARFAAVFIDGLMLGAVNMGIGFVAGLFMAQSAAISSDGKNTAAFLTLQFILFFINIAIAVSYEGIMIGKYGATLGKMACKVKVVTADGGKVGYGRAFGRYFAKILSGITCMIGYIIALFDDQKRALHDHICNTRVVER